MRYTMKQAGMLVGLVTGLLAIGCGSPSPEPEPGPFCGGIAGIACPGLGTCEDDPSDDCDPNGGGADCGGVCSCNALALCVEGYAFDPAPEVCDCVPSQPIDPCATVLCPPDTFCSAPADEPMCVPIAQGADCGPTMCGDGMVCCNSSCGICTPPGGVCIQIACE